MEFNFDKTEQPLISLSEAGNRTSFEKLLFANNHIKCLKKIIEVKDKIIVGYSDTLDKKIYEQSTNIQVNKLRREVKILNDKAEKYRNLYESSLIKR